MQSEKNQSYDDFRNTFNKIDYFYHVKEYKSFSQSKIIHLKPEKRHHPSDYYVQMRRLLLHMIYLYYVAYIKQKNFYLYPHICINKWGVLFRYYSFDKSSEKTMKLIEYQNFKDNVKKQFGQIWELKKKEQKQQQDKQQEEAQTNLPNKKTKTAWRQFAEQIVKIYDENSLPNLTPKDIISKFQETKHVKNNVLIVGVLTSTIFPSVKLNKSVEKVFQQICQQQPFIIGNIFSETYSSQATKDFINSIIKFFKILNDFKILGITTTISDKQGPKTQQDESLLTEFRLSLGRVLVENETNSETLNIIKQNTGSSNTSSEHDYSQGNEGKDLGHLKCQYFWSKRMQSKELTFRVSIFINKKIYPLYFRQIQQVWYKLSQKWKVILDETKQLSSFNPGFVTLGYDKESYQISFTQYVKCQPFQKAISELIITTDKLIIAILVMKDIICFYERKSLSVQILKQEFVMNDGRLEDIARSICQSIKNYYDYSKQVMGLVDKNRIN